MDKALSSSFAPVDLVLKNLVLPRQGGIFDGPCLFRIAGDSLLF